MAELVYPSSLPGPLAAPIQAADRRVTSDLPGPRADRPSQRDRLAQQQLSFLYTFDDAAVFDSWWSEELSDGGAWFASAWPLPQGGVGVRKFLGEPNWTELVSGVGWRMTANFEVRGRGMLPQRSPVPLLLMHFNGNIVDESGRGSFSGGGAITADTPKFGSGAWRDSAAAAGKLTSNNRGAFNLGADDFQLEGWVRIATLAGNPSRIINLHALTALGSTPGAGGNAFQLGVEINGASGGQLQVFFSRETGASSTIGLVGAHLVPVGTWVHWAVCQDATSLRSYLDGHLAAEEPVHRLYNATPFTNQGWIIGASHAGGGWPGLYTNFLQGDLDEVRLTREVTYVGSSFSVPTGPFRG